DLVWRSHTRNVPRVSFARHLMSGDPDCSATRTPALGFWLLAGLWCIGFFSLSGCKLPGYVLPAFPCLCLALGDFIARTKWCDLWATRATVGTIAALLVLGFYFVVPSYTERRSPSGSTDIAAWLRAARGAAMCC